MSVLERAVRLALRALPEPMRSRVGADVGALTRRRIAEARGPLRRAAVAAACLADIVRRGLYERFGRRSGHGGSGRVADARRGHPIDRLLTDFRHAARSLARTPRFSLAVVFILSLGIGANSAIFSVVHGVMLRPLPFPDAERTALVGIDYGDLLVAYMPYFRADQLRRNARAFQAVAGYAEHAGRVTVDGGFARVAGLRVDGPFLDAVGFSLAMGRWFTTDELTPDGPAAVILTAGVWRSRFAGRPDALGEDFTLDDRTYTVVGVLPDSFAFPLADGHDDDVEYLVAAGMRATPEDQIEDWAVIVRLADGASRAAAREELRRTWAMYAAAYPDLVYESERGFVLATFGDLYAGTVSTILWLLLVAVGVVLLIACTNVATLLLARAAQRRQEVALRSALGAAPSRIVRYVLTESALLSGGAAVIGVFLADRGARLLVAAAPFEMPRTDGIAVDGPVLLFTVAWAVATALLFGSMSAIPVLRTDPARVLRVGKAGGAGGARLRKALVMAQSALSVVLLVGAGLLLGTLREIRSVDPGFDPRGLVAAKLPTLPPETSGPDAMAELARRITETLTTDPAIRAAAAASSLPLERGANIPTTVAGRPEASEGAVEWRAVTPAYFEILGIGLLEGRVFDTRDRAGGDRVAIVNRSFAERYFPGVSALGQDIQVGAYRGEFHSPELDVGAVRVVGVVADVRDRSLKEAPRRALYVPFAQAPARLARPPVFLVEGPRARDVVGAIRTAVADADARLGAPDVRPLDDVVAASLATERFNAFLIATFAGLALLLTVSGIYGVVSWSVSHRTRDIGVHLALGAPRSTVVRAVIVEGMRPVLFGAVAGASASLWLGRLIQSLVWGVQPHDPATLVTVGVGLVAVAVLAAWLPARAVSCIDPVRVLAGD